MPSTDHRVWRCDLQLLTYVCQKTEREPQVASSGTADAFKAAPDNCCE